MNLSKETTTGLLLFAFFVFGSGCSDTVTPSNMENAASSKGDFDCNTIATVNGIPVSRDEFLYVMKKESSSVAGSYMTENKVEYDEGFWEEKHGDAKETPLEKLKKTALSELEKTKHLQFLAQESGIIDEIKAFGKLKGELAEVNAERAKTKSENGILHGPLQFTFDIYYRMTNNNLEYALKKGLVDSGNAWHSDSDAKAHYEKMKESVFNRGHQLRYYEIRVPAELPTPEITDRIRAILLSRSEIETDSFSSLPTMIANAIIVAKHELHTTESTQDERHDKTKSILGGLQVGEASNLIMGEPYAVIYKLLEKLHLGYLSFDDAKYGILRELCEDRVDSLLANSSLHVKTEINHELYDSLSQ
ncbi:MAG: hypothetical protein OSB39_13065 [Opitutales bacterium]|nr:hypothetical protein [Opitutales bacterium]